MEYLDWSGLAVVVRAFAVVTGFDRERVFYPMLLTVIAPIASSPPALAFECLMASAFLALAVAGFKRNLWLIVVTAFGTRPSTLI